jgi:hypothetical protein
MANVAPNLDERQEFWKPAVDPHLDEQPAEPARAVCSNCGTDFLIGSRFCYMCGNDRQGVPVETASRRLPAWFDIASLQELLGQSALSLVALILGCACIVAAIITGIRFTATTLLDWQAIQLWRIEWLLAAIALFVAGILLKKQ